MAYLLSFLVTNKHLAYFMPFLDKLQRKSLDIVVFTHFSDIEANEQLLHFENIKI